jgi:ABC-type glycerol-3-phosphate transport system substrate-binding protein
MTEGETEMRIVKQRFAMLWIALAVMVAIAAGCGGNDDYDVSVFIMPQTGMSGDMEEKLQASLQAKYDETTRVGLRTSPLYSLEKLTVEIISKEHVLLIVTERDFKNAVNQGGGVELDSSFDKNAHAAGVVNDKLYGIPVKNLAWMKSAGYNGGEMIAFIPANTPNMEQSMEMLKKIMEP